METTPQFLGLPLLAWIPALPLLGALINLTVGRRFSKSTVHTIAIAAVAGACGIAFYMVFGPLWKQFKGGEAEQGITQVVYHWLEVGNFKADLAFHLDTLSAVMIIIVTFIGTWIHIYSTGYMAHDPGYHRYFGYLNLFTGAMLILVLAGNLPVMFIGWEGVGLCSFLLIGFWYENESYANAGRKAFVVNRIGDFCFLLGMFLLFWATKTLDFQDLKDIGKHGAEYVQPFWGRERLSAAAGIFLFIGACGKSAQLPLFVWLPDAMAGPTPVSALIHAATMVTAGVYMICRLSFLYASSTTALIVVSTVGLLTALAAAFMAFAQTDLKKVLAYSTVSQLGFMFVAAGTGNWVAAIFHLGTHAFFKACLFLGAGSVMHGMEHGGSTTPGDITTMGGLRKHMPLTRITFMISCLAIAGIFPFSGFFSKDEILAGDWAVHPPGWPPFYGKILWGGLLIAALGTAFYMWRLYFLVFGGEERSEEAKHAHESPFSMTVPLMVLAFFATVVGFLGLPHLEHTHLPGITHSLSSWLEPSVAANWYNPGDTTGLIHGEVHDGTLMVLMGIALMIGVIGIAIAWALYGRGPSPTVTRLVDHGPLEGAYIASKNKLWFDEIYDVIIVRPFRAVARGLFEVVDRFIIDTVAVNGSAFVVGLFGRVSRWVQNGNVQRYLV
ncbi:MAG TPA: NADH-quinone oxidoreductase subunit L, partial [Kofleriaceae bacterium]|nr:NADH-quinone oxidoreductase subunit L [Kofleriaceae bacterium]